MKKALLFGLFLGVVAGFVVAKMRAPEGGRVLACQCGPNCQCGPTCECGK